MKLYVWTGYSPDWSDGLAFAIAENEVEAKKLIEEKRGFEIYTWGELEIHELNIPYANQVNGGS